MAPLLRRPHRVPGRFGASSTNSGVRSLDRLGHVDLRTTARYAAARPEQIDNIADVPDRRHHAARRAGEAM